MRFILLSFLLPIFSLAADPPQGDALGETLTASAYEPGDGLRQDATAPFE